VGQSKNNYQHNDDGTTHIFLETKNKRFPGKHTIIIDTEDWEEVKEYSWRIHGNKATSYPYAQTSIPNPEGGWTCINATTKNGSKRREKRKRVTTLPLHHVIIGKPPKGKMVDHIDRNGLNNRRENLRLTTNSQNQRNSKGSSKSSQYKGVYRDISNNKWAANIGHEGKVIYIGSFTCEKEAALAYNKKALELWGDEHAFMNKVEQDG